MCKDKIKDSLKQFPAVAIIGPRQSGKTTLARTICQELALDAEYLDLEMATDLQKLDDPEMYLRQLAGRLVILDEVQRKPELFPLLRALIDIDRRPGRYLILGSASPDLLKQSSESLAGRICYHELTPFYIDEIPETENNYNPLWLRGGYPNSFLADSDFHSFNWRQSFIQSHLDRDLPGLGFSYPSTMLYRFWQMMAHSHGQLWNASKIAGSLGIDPKTCRRYLDVLEDTFMIRQIQPYAGNLKKRLIKSPKVYLRDSGLFHCLLHIQDQTQLLGHPIAGASWEGFCLEQIMARMPWRRWTSFYRTASGAEMDLVIQKDIQTVDVAVEFKYSLAPYLTRGFWQSMNDLKPEKAFIVYPGREYYRIKQSVYALPVTQLDRIFES
jgi:predicted AAA+ superfamily ATPase